jgi:hypothetical protein
MSLALADLQTWLADVGEFTNVQLNRLQSEPDQAIAVAVAGGSSPILDGAFESTTIHVRVRETTDAEAETSALAVHAFLSAHEGSFEMGDTYVLTIVPSSGPPQYFDRDVENRTTYMGSYQFTVAV